MIKLKYHKLYSDVSSLKSATFGAACYDICAYFGPNERQFKVYDSHNASMVGMAFQHFIEEPIHYILRPGERALIPTGIILDIPKGHSVRIHPRSGMAIKHGVSLVNCEGVVDEDYVEQVFIPMINFSNKDVRIEHGDRIAQIELVKTLESKLEICERPSQKTDRNGGFGSTGK